MRGKYGLMLVALALLAGLGSATGCGDDRVSVVVYSPHGRELLGLLEEAYEQRFPEIDIRWLDMGSQEVYDRIRSEAVNPQADVWFGGPDTIFARGAAEGLLQSYAPSWAQAVPETSRHPEGLYFGIYRSCPILVYNSDVVSADEAPADWDDLLDPRWQDKIVMRDPLASGTLRTVFTMVLARSVAETGDPEQGYDWLRRLDAQTREYVPNPALLFEKLIRQEGVVSMWELTDILLRERQGLPLAHRFATSGTPVIDDSIGLVAGAGNAEAAKAFIDWVGEVEALELVAREAFRLPARTDMPVDRLPPWAQKVVEELLPIPLDKQLITERGQEWMATWDRTIRGRGTQP